ncbi:MAG: 30S ribosomal protein S18 [Mycolicibacterium sp.]|nr:30S ribosomal protein S18 [Mycolicibacterium sp.]
MAAKRRDNRPEQDKRKPRRNLSKQLGITEVDYKDTATLRQFISDRGKIRSRAVTGLSVQQQRQVATAIKNAREMALLPYGPAAPRG